MRLSPSPLALLLLSACADKGADTADSGPTQATSYQLNWWTDPSPAVAGEAAELYLQILDQDGAPVENLQQNHQRMDHILVISQDLSSFEHRHHEDHYEVTADTLREATFHTPETFPYSGRFLIAIDFASANLYQQLSDVVEVEGDLPQLDAPEVDLSTTVSTGEVTAEFTWEIPAIAGLESVLWAHLSDADGAPIADLTQWLGADAHLAIVKDDLSWVGHTHAYVEGMDSAPPGHTMPAVWTGPDVPFHVIAEYPGTYKAWLQFTREGAPDDPYTVPFMFEVSP